MPAPARAPLRTLALFLALGPAGTLRAADEPPAKGGVTVFVGTYTGGQSQSQGIYRFDFDPETGTPRHPRLAAESPSPSFLALAPGGRSLYAANEVDAFRGQPGGSVSAFAVHPKTGALAPRNARPSGGAAPCHVVVDRAGKNVLVANYGGGSVAVLPIDEGGGLRNPSAIVRHAGKGARPDRQGEPHAHSINLDPANRFAFVADLGLDKVLVYRFNPASGMIAPNDPPAANTAPGAGPRHFAFHPTGRFAYAIDELNSTVTAWTYDARGGRLAPLQTISTLPTGDKTPNYPADIHAHPSGKFLYGSNRGHDSIVVYAVDPGTGKLTYVENEREGIKTPRNFAVDPSGRWLLVANQDSDSVAVFRVDPDTGALTPTGKTVAVPRPVCLQFWTPAG